VNVTLRGRSFSRDEVRELILRINEARDDGAVIVVHTGRFRYVLAVLGVGVLLVNVALWLGLRETTLVLITAGWCAAYVIACWLEDRA